MQDVTAGTGKGNSGHEQFNDASAGAGTKGCNSSQGNQKGNLSIPDQPPLISPANVLWCHQKQQLTLLELKAECLQHLESINVQGGELAEFVMPLRVYLADSKTSQDDATERRNLCYFLKIVKKHANNTGSSAHIWPKLQSGTSHASSRIQLFLWTLCTEQCNRDFQSWASRV